MATTTWEGFRSELAEREDSIAEMLPPSVPSARFREYAVAAVRHNPSLLNCTKRSLFGAIDRAAQDGLMPDGREGVINVYRTKQKDNSWQETAQWIPMTHGLRKRAKEIDRIIVDAQVVYENDTFAYWQGDDPRIEHAPAPLGQHRGKLIGAYAVFKAHNGAVLHREVMDAEQIERVRSQSKQPDGLMWTKFTEEAWRKTVIRRGFKSVPCSERLQAVVHRDDEMFEFEEQQEGRRPAARIVQASPSGARRPLPPLVGAGPRFLDSERQAHFDAQAPVGEDSGDELDPSLAAYWAGQDARERGLPLASVPDEHKDHSDQWQNGWRAKDAELRTVA